MPKAIKRQGRIGDASLRERSSSIWRVYFEKQRVFSLPGGQSGRIDGDGPLLVSVVVVLNGVFETPGNSGTDLWRTQQTGTAPHTKIVILG